MKRIISLLKNDFKNIVRDTILIASLVAPVIIIVFVRYGIPIVNDYLFNYTGYSLNEHYPFIVSLFILFIPSMMGILAGFLLLDQRDEGIITYLTITPLGRSGYLFFRIIIPVIVGFIFSIVFLKINGIAEFSLYKTWPILLVAALEAPMVALFLGGFAKNKVEGLALSKVSGLLYIGSIIGYLGNGSWWSWTGAIFPPFWITGSLMKSLQGNDFFLLVIFGFVFHLIINFLLLKRLDRVIN